MWKKVGDTQNKINKQLQKNALIAFHSETSLTSSKRHVFLFLIGISYMSFACQHLAGLLSLSTLSVLKKGNKKKSETR